MPWNDEEFTRSRAELLDGVRRRGERLRQRRRLAWALAVPVVLLAVALPAAVSLSGAEDRGTRVAASGSGTRTTGTTAPAVFPPPTLSGVTVSTVAVTTTSVTMVPSTLRPITTTTQPAAEPTTAPTTPASAPGSTSTTDPTGPYCAPAMFEARLTTTKQTYKVGEGVSGTATFTNTSGQTCYFASTDSGFDVLDATGASVTLNVRVHGDTFRMNPVPPGEAKTSTQNWDQMMCRPPSPCTPASPGRYTFVVVLGPYGTARATFDIVP